VVGSFLVQHVEVLGRRVPFPAGILHPDCTLQGLGDTGRLGVPTWWARQEGLLSGATVASGGLCNSK
jgi:hypothetical protein